MSTFGEIKTSLARRLGDPDHAVFLEEDLADMVNEAIAEVSRIAPQPFLEDVTPIRGNTRYRLRGGSGNLLANPSFEQGDQSVLDQAVQQVAVENSQLLLSGWGLLADGGVHLPRNPNRISGLRVLRQYPAVGAIDQTVFQDVPVNAETTYQFEGWFWKELPGGNAARIALDALDPTGVFIENLFNRSTTAGLPVQASTSYATPDDGSVGYLRVRLVAGGAQPDPGQAFLFEDISLAEASQSVLVAENATASIEVSRVEIWKNVDGMPRPVSEVFRPGLSRQSQFSDVGWRIWGGVLEIPWRVMDALSEDQYFRVWGYAPYDPLVDDTQVTDLTLELEWAVLAYCDMVGMRRLLAERNLFSQWQTHANNTDVTPAGLAGRIFASEQTWDRKARQLYVLRA